MLPEPATFPAFQDPIAGIVSEHDHQVEHEARSERLPPQSHCHCPRSPSRRFLHRTSLPSFRLWVLSSTVAAMKTTPGFPPKNRQPTASDEKPLLTAAELLPLFRLLTKEPPKGHDFKTCPLCRQFGIDRI